MATASTAKNSDVFESGVTATAPFTDDASWTWEAVAGPGEVDPFAADAKLAIGQSTGTPSEARAGTSSVTPVAQLFNP